MLGPVQSNGWGFRTPPDGFGAGGLLLMSMLGSTACAAGCCVAESQPATTRPTSKTPTQPQNFVVRISSPGRSVEKTTGRAD